MQLFDTGWFVHSMRSVILSDCKHCILFNCDLIDQTYRAMYKKDLLKRKSSKQGQERQVRVDKYSRKSHKNHGGQRYMVLDAYLIIVCLFFLHSCSAGCFRSKEVQRTLYYTSPVEASKPPVVAFLYAHTAIYIRISHTTTYILISAYS